MTTLALHEIVQTQQETREPLLNRALRSRRLGGFVFDALFIYESLKEKIIKTSAVTLGGVGVAAFMTGLAQKGTAAAETATGAIVANVMDNPDLLTPTEAMQESNNLIAAGAVAIVAAGVINMIHVGSIERDEDCGLGVINPDRDLSETYKVPALERFDEWASYKLERIKDNVVKWWTDIQATRRAQTDPENLRFKPQADPFAVYHNTIGEPLFPVDESVA